MEPGKYRFIKHELPDESICYIVYPVSVQKLSYLFTEKNDIARIASETAMKINACSKTKKELDTILKDGLGRLGEKFYQRIKGDVEELKALANELQEGPEGNLIEVGVNSGYANAYAFLSEYAEKAIDVVELFKREASANMSWNSIYKNTVDDLVNHFLNKILQTYENCLSQAGISLDEQDKNYIGGESKINLMRIITVNSR